MRLFLIYLSYRDVNNIAVGKKQVNVGIVPWFIFFRIIPQIILLNYLSEFPPVSWWLVVGLPTLCRD